MTTKSPFDLMAETYDADFTTSAIGKAQRKQVWDCLLPLLNASRKTLKILEINCGTGHDAIQLCNLGHSVTATDASEAMIGKARQKMTENCKELRLKSCRFDQLRKEFKHEKFDLIISNFGGLNCIDRTDLAKLSEDLHSILEPGGHLFLVIMSRACLWETIYFLYKGRPYQAFRRRRKKLPFTAGDSSIPISYYSPRQLRSIFTSGYLFSGSYPVGFFVPPTYLEKQFAKRPTLLTRFERWDKKSRTHSILANLADHFCIIFQKK